MKHTATWKAERRSAFFFSPKIHYQIRNAPFNGCRGSIQGLKRPGREVDDLPLSKDEVRNKWIYTSTPPVCLHGMNRDHYT